MGKELKSRHQARDHAVVNSADDEVQIGTTADKPDRQPAGHDLRPGRRTMTGSDRYGPDAHRK